MKTIAVIILKEDIVDKAINSPRSEFPSKDYVLEREEDGYAISNKKRPDLDMWVPSVAVKVVHRSEPPTDTKPATPAAMKGKAA